MGLNFRKSIRIGKHTRINLSKSGIGVSTGVKGARVSVGPRGVRKTVGIPGTGVYYTKQESLNKLKQGNNNTKPPISGGQPINKKQAGCGCLSMIVVFFIVISIAGSLLGGNKKQTSTKPKTNKTQISASKKASTPKKSDTDTTNKPAATNNTSTANDTKQTATPAPVPSQSANSNSSTVASPAPPAQTNQSQDQNQNVTVYVTKTGKKYHNAGCRELRKSSTPMSLKDAKAQGYTPCKLCNPPQ